MPCLLKQRTKRSPGVITFTHSEVLNGVVAKSQKIRQCLDQASAEKNWLFGVHIQGDCSHLKSWPLSDWQSFVMWSDPKASFLANVPAIRKTPITCVNFLPAPKREFLEKSWDICVVSRPSEIKRIKETLLVIQRLFELKEDLSVVFVVPDPRNLSFGARAYQKQGIDQSYFTLPRRIFTCRQLKQISFISSSQFAFGTFPVSDDLIAELIGRARFLFLPSHKEGVPRVIAEALTQGTPCIVSKNLASGLNQYLNEFNALKVDDDVFAAAAQIKHALDGYSRYAFNKFESQEQFCDTWHIPKLKDFLSQKIEEVGAPVEGLWCLEELDLRLACHGRKHNMQFMNDDRLFFDWMAKVESCEDREPDEDYLFGSEPIRDRRQLSWVEVERFWRSSILHPAARRVKAVLRR